MKLAQKIIGNGSLLILALTLFMCKTDCAQSERCQLDPDPGPCKAAFRKYYYDKKEKSCKEFIYGGCDGVVPFETLEECKTCECNNKGS